MARSNKKTKAAKRTSSRTSESKVTVDRGQENSGGFLDKIQNDLEKNQSYLNLILGALIVIVLGVLIFNYFNKPGGEEGNLTPQAEQTIDEQGDVTREGLPGKYTVKEGDTLYLIAQKYYDDGNKYTDLIETNSLPSENIEVGQELTIPKLETDALALSSASPEPSSSPEDSAQVIESASPSPEPVLSAPSGEKGTGGAMNQTTWGEAITADSYTVQSGDWLSKISGRAYGDIMKYDTLAKANNISNPDSIEVGTVLKIPRN